MYTDSNKVSCTCLYIAPLIKQNEQLYSSGAGSSWRPTLFTAFCLIVKGVTTIEDTGMSSEMFLRIWGICITTHLG